VAGVARGCVGRGVQTAGGAWRTLHIADFFAPSVGLVVEVDGGVHGGRGAADSRRDERLRRLGYRVVRVEAALVMRDTAAVLAVVRAALT
jgi:very-short-patch-repair endonuclease